MKNIFKNIKNISKVNICIMFAVTFAFLAVVSSVKAETMSSSNYKMESDSLNFGGNRSTSSSYNIEDTQGEIATGMSSSTNYTLLAGYQQMNVVTITVVPAGNVSMSPSIGGVTGGTSNGQTDFKVTTDGGAGYLATIAASTSPALQNATSSFADYVPATSAPDFTFTNANTASSFGFTPEGEDIDTRYKYTGGSCNASGGTYSPGSCWDGLSITPKTIVTRTSANAPSGITTTLKFRAASGSSHVQMSGVYTATTTITVTSN